MHAQDHMQYLKSIIERDEELDKFYFLLSRQVALSLKSSSYAEKVGIPQRPLLLPYFNYAKTLERLGDVFVSLAKNSSKRSNSHRRTS